MGCGSFHRPIRLETSYHGKPPSVGHRHSAFLVFGQQLVGAKRNCHVVPVPNLHAKKRGRRDTYHWKWVAVQTQRATERPRIAAKLPLPKRMAEYRPRVVACLIVV